MYCWHGGYKVRNSDFATEADAPRSSFCEKHNKRIVTVATIDDDCTPAPAMGEEPVPGPPPQMGQKPWNSRRDTLPDGPETLELAGPEFYTLDSIGTLPPHHAEEVFQWCHRDGIMMMPSRWHAEPCALFYLPTVPVPRRVPAVNTCTPPAPQSFRSTGTGCVELSRPPGGRTFATLSGSGIALVALCARGRKEAGRRAPPPIALNDGLSRFGLYIGRPCAASGPPAPASAVD